MTAIVLALVFLGVLFLIVGGFVFLNRRRLGSSDAARVRVGEVGGLIRSKTPVSILRDERVSEIRNAESELVRQFVEETSGPAIVLGDFNTTADSIVFRSD